MRRRKKGRKYKRRRWRERANWAMQPGSGTVPRWAEVPEIKWAVLSRPPHRASEDNSFSFEMCLNFSSIKIQSGGKNGGAVGRPQTHLL